MSRYLVQFAEPALGRYNSVASATAGSAASLMPACTGACSFSRTFRSTQDHTVTWTASVVAARNSGFSSVSVTPAKISVKALAYSQTMTFNASTTALAADGKFHFAEVVLTPDDTRLPPLHLSMAVAVPPA